MKVFIRIANGIAYCIFGLLIAAIGVLFLIGTPESSADVGKEIISAFASVFMFFLATLITLMGLSLLFPRRLPSIFDIRTGTKDAHRDTKKVSPRIMTEYPLDYSAFKESTFVVVKKVYKQSSKYYLAPMKVALGLEVTLLIVVLISVTVNDYTNYFLLLPALVLVGILGVMVVIKAQNSRIGVFSQDNGFTFNSDGSEYLMSGTIFSGYGKNETVSNVVRGRLIDKTPFSVFSYSFDAVPHENIKNIFKIRTTKTNTYKTTSLSFIVSKKLPHILLDNKKNDLFGYNRLPTIHKRRSLDKLDLEGHFNDYYSLFYTTDGTRKINKPAYVLSILSPDFMYWLVNLDSNYDIEWVGNRVFIHAPFTSISKDATVENLINAAEQLEPRMRQALRTFKHDD